MNLPITVRTFSLSFHAATNNPYTVDLNALAWLEDYLQTWSGTLLVVYVFFTSVCSFGLYSLFQIPRPRILVRSLRGGSELSLNMLYIRDAVATDIVHQHSGRLDYYKGCLDFNLTIRHFS
jgi:ATP-binding cassette subfamily F protein 3